MEWSDEFLLQMKFKRQI